MTPAPDALGWVILTVLVLLFVLELWGIVRPGKGDTITEVFRWVRDKLPVWLRYPFLFLVMGLCIWFATTHIWDLA